MTPELLGYLTNDQIQAFLRVIREGESNQDESAFTILYGGGHFDSFADHPRIRFPIVYQGKENYTTAAGAFQITETTWNEFTHLYGQRPFDPENQTLCAVWRLVYRNAIDDIIAGRLLEAIRKCTSEWTSLAIPSRQKAAPSIFEAYGGRIAVTPEAPPIPFVPEAILSVPPPSVPKAKVKPMGVFAALLPSLLQMLPQLIPIFGSTTDSEVAKRNQAAGMIVADTLIKATDAVNIQEAHDKMQADPAMVQAASDALSEILPQLLDVGGGVESSRKFAAEHEAGRYGRILEVVTYAGLVFLLLANASAFAFAWKQDDFSVMADIKQADIGVALIVFGFWLGTSISSKRKDEIGGRQ